MTIRRSRLSDAEAVCRIYNREVLTSTATFDTESRTLAEQEASMRLRGERHPLLVAVARDEVLGYGSISAYSAKPGYAHTVEDSVYVAEDHRGCGVGGRLLGELVAEAERAGHHCVIARIVADHERSIRLHERQGFVRVGVEREVGRKFGRWLDVLVMQRVV